MRYFIDTEFSERGPAHPILLISLALVAEDGREFYAIHSEVSADDCNEWVQANVLPHLDLGDGWDRRCALDEMAEQIKQFCDPDKYGKPEFQGYYADYDWVVFCQIFGAMVDLPKGWPRYCNDIKQFAVSLGNPALPKQFSTEHNALCDARWNKQAWEFLSAWEKGVR